MPEPRAHFELEVSHAHAIAQAVTKVRGVAALDGGSFSSVSLYLPGERIVGMRRPNPRDDRHLQINIRVDISAAPDLYALAEDIRSAARGACPELQRIDVEFSDAVDYTTLGIISGLILAFFLHLGWGPTLLAALLAAIGGIVGAHFDGRIDLTSVWNGLIGKEKGQG